MQPTALDFEYVTVKETDHLYFLELTIKLRKYTLNK